MKKKKLILYILASIIWIFGTNFLVDHYIPSSYIHVAERVKEVFYVVVTGCFFYIMLNKTEAFHAAKVEEERLSTLINSMVDFVNFKDGEGRWIEANQFGLKLFQLENVDYKGKKDSDLAEHTVFYGDALRYCEISDEEAWQNGGVTRVEEMIPLPDGTEKTFDTIKVPLFHPDGSRNGLVIIGRDISERKHVEKLLEESQEQYNSLFLYSPDIVYVLDMEGTITNLNPQFQTVTGYPVAKYIGKNIKHLLKKYRRHPAVQHISGVIAEKTPRISEVEFKRSNGSTVTLQTTSVPIIVDGNMKGIIGFGKDITQIKQTEERLRRTEKLSVVGELSASVAHEIRNPLTSLKGFVQLLKMEDEKHQLYYQIMLDELDRINHIVGELLLLAKPQQLKYTKADIQNILYDVISLLKTEASMLNVQLDFIYAGHIEIDCEPNQLKQLFINIIKNAIEASAGGGEVSITLSNPDDDNVSVTVRDNGYGISEELLQKIGEPFYSSKEKGTGLGLTVSFKIVEAHNGTIKFNSEVNEGTEVVIELPLSNNNVSGQREAVELAH
ncbi:PAS domain-containing sensor histidine kinase [Bacillus sp. T33-2]|uniref:PAS domain-containing sensor histidine kinase n=1 Tax=Bacillus sp. T33-2 TaxID=2054168 RepID=UPI000C78C457|nr:PAS domain S-box protein [Bacillus sp. T33-2]PLR96896.1 PAS domain-containing sensor histidine kinase [Bacillus sp. T33-2]